MWETDVKADALHTAIRDLPPAAPSERDFPDGFDPLATCPPAQRGKYEKVALRAANGSLAAAARLKCLECVAWQPAEVRKCEIRSCPLWLRSRKGRK